MSRNWIIYIVLFLTFVAAMALFESIYMTWTGLNIERKVKVRKRLRMLSAGGVSHDQAISLLHEAKLSDNPFINQFMLRVPRFHLMDKSLERAGLDINVAQYMAIQMVMAVAVFILLCWLTRLNVWADLVVALAAGISLPILYVRRRQQERMRRFTELLPDTMEYISRSMRAGIPFSASLKGASQEMPEPIASELAVTFDELNFGLDLEQALHNLGERTGSSELRYFIAAVLIQRTTGGNLAEVLSRIATIMRQRFSMVREVHVLSAEMHYSANVLICLPFFMALIINIINPEYLAELTHNSFGIVLIFVQITLMLVGWFVIKQMINIRI